MKELRTKYPGIRTRHHEHCALLDDGGRRCSCGARSVIARVSVPGSRRPLSKTLPTVSEARAWKQDREREIRRQPDRRATLTAGALADRYLEALRDGRTLTRSGRPPTPATVRDIEGGLNRHVLPRLADTPVDRVTRGAMQGIADDLAAAGLSPSRIHSVMAAAGSMWRWAIARELADQTPTANLELPADTARRELPPHTPAQIAELIAAVRPEDRAAWALWGWAGLRKMEVARLEWPDIDLKERVVLVREGKTANATRAVPIIDPLYRVLLEHRLAVGRIDQGPVMRPLYRANPGTGWGVDKAIVRARRTWTAAGLEPITPHPMRHLVGTWLMQAGVQAVVRAAWLGHSRHSLGVTDSVYTHVSPTDLQDAARRLERLVSGSQKEDASHHASQ